MVSASPGNPRSCDVALRRPLALGRKRKAVLVLLARRASVARGHECQQSLSEVPNVCHKAPIAAELGWQRGQKKSDTGELERSGREGSEVWMHFMEEEKKTWKKGLENNRLVSDRGSLSEASLGGGGALCCWAGDRPAGAAHWPTNVLGPCEVTEAPLDFLPGWRPGVCSGLLGDGERLGTGHQDATGLPVHRERPLPDFT